MTRTHLLATALLCALGVAAPALAQQYPPPTPPEQAPPDPMDAPTPQTVPATPATPAMSATPADNVTVTSHPGNSISPNYHVDFDAMDANHDGAITRAEGRGNPDLMREFHVVDSNHNGRLTREEMKGWLD
jgi:hypothetical protein